jgi:HD-GYP domain-containing protein (c-di-GMP phosphodiesterase class II)/uncharacterized protein YigA (DUF484 family)
MGAENSMVMDIGEGSNPLRPASWFVKSTDNQYLTSSRSPQESQFASADILWAVDDRGVFTLFESKCNPGMDKGTERIIGQSVFEVFKNSPSAVDAIHCGLAGNRVDATIDLAGNQWDVRGYPLRNDEGHISGLVGVANNITEQKHNAEDQLMILDILTTLRSATSYAEMLPVILEQAQRLFRPLGVVLAMCAGPDCDMHVEVASGIWQTLAGKHIRTGIHSWGDINDPYITSLDELPGELVNSGDCFIGGVKLAAQGNLIGTFWVASSNSFGERERQSMIAFAEIIADALFWIKPQERIQLRSERLEALHDIDRAITNNTNLSLTLNVILSHVLIQFGVDAAAILLLDANTNRLEYFVGSGFFTDIKKSPSLRLDECQWSLATINAGLMGRGKPCQCDPSCNRLLLLQREGFVSHFGAPLVVRKQVKGVIELFHRSPMRPGEEWFSFLEAIATQAAIAVDNAALFNDLQLSNAELSLVYETTLEGWVRALDLRDKETEGHTQRVTEMTLQLAQSLGFNSHELTHIRRGALLHDIGKIGISDSILNKMGPLSEGEWVIMKRHPVYAKNLLEPISFLSHSIDIPYYHHEKWDGTGYPNGLKGELIPLSARIFAVVDVWDALRSNRPYRPAWSSKKTAEYILQQSGSHFDPQIVSKFFELGLDKGNGRS